MSTRVVSVTEQVRRINKCYAAKKDPKISKRASGLKWRECDTEATKVGDTKLLEHSGLAEALTRQTEFTQQEWLAFGIKNLRIDNVVKSRLKYFVPDDKGGQDGFLGTFGHQNDFFEGLEAFNGRPMVADDAALFQKMRDEFLRCTDSRVKNIYASNYEISTNVCWPLPAPIYPNAPSCACPSKPTIIRKHIQFSPSHLHQAAHSESLPCWACAAVHGMGVRGRAEKDPLRFKVAVSWRH